MAGAASLIRSDWEEPPSMDTEFYVRTDELGLRALQPAGRRRLAQL